MIINECYLCKDNTYIIINYNNNKVIEHEKVDKLSKIFTREYSNFELKDIITIIRTIFNTEYEKLLKVTIVQNDDIKSLVYFSKGKIIKYLNKVDYKEKYILEIKYTSRSGLNITSNTKDNELSSLISSEINKITSLEKISPLSLNKEDKILYKIYKLFYNRDPDFLDNIDKIKTQIMVYILMEYGISIYEEEDFKLYNSIPFSIEIAEKIRKLSLFNNIPDININKEYKNIISHIGKILSNEITDIDELILLVRYMYINKYRDSNYIDNKPYKLIKKINIEVEKNNK